ncbi:MAG: ABC transporter ATP-binding protein [Bacteroidetes bacterium]|jgi:ABC-type bacteriocin/lantibiotic exporter with double-glycine peptidase domain|nr:ABC transporter ATP-binding protein [Bacteroidota bacterium]
MIGNNLIELTPFKRILRWINIEKRNIQFLYVYAIISGILSLVIPLGIQAMVGIILGGNLNSSWVIIVVCVTSLVAISGIIKLAQLSILDSIQRKLFVRYTMTYNEVLENRIENNTGNDIAKQTSKFLDIVTLQKTFSKLIFDFSSQVLQIIAGILLLSFYHPFFIGVGVVIFVVVLLGFKFTWEKGFATARNESNMKFKVADTLNSQSKSSQTDIMEKNHSESLNEALGSYVQYRQEHFSILYKQATFGIVTKTILTFIMLVIGSRLLVTEEISLGQFLASEILIITLLDATEKLILTVENIYDSGIAAEKLDGIERFQTSEMEEKK